MSITASARVTEGASLVNLTLAAICINIVFYFAWPSEIVGMVLEKPKASFTTSAYKERHHITSGRGPPNSYSCMSS